MGTVGALAIVSLGALWESVSRVPSMEHRVCTESRNSRVRIFCTCRSSHFHHVQAIHRQGRANAALFESFACVRPPRARQMKRATTLLQLVTVPRTARQPPVREPARQPHQDYSRDGRRYPVHRRLRPETLSEVRIMRGPILSLSWSETAIVIVGEAMASLWARRTAESEPVVLDQSAPGLGLHGVRRKSGTLRRRPLARGLS